MKGTGVILSGAILLAKRRILRVAKSAPREIPPPAELHRGFGMTPLRKFQHQFFYF